MLGRKDRSEDQDPLKIGDHDPPKSENQDPSKSEHPDASNADDLPALTEEAESRIQEIEDPDAPDIEQLQRLKAEFDNYRRRTAREREEWFRTAQGDVVSRLLPVLDDLRRARAHERESGEPPDVAGLLLILKRFEDALAQLGLEELTSERGAEFDPMQHEAVMTSTSEDVPEGAIFRALEPGFLYHGRLLRPAKVCVSSGPPE